MLKAPGYLNYQELHTAVLNGFGAAPSLVEAAALGLGLADYGMQVPTPVGNFTSRRLAAEDASSSMSGRLNTTAETSPGNLPLHTGSINSSGGTNSTGNTNGTDSSGVSSTDSASKSVDIGTVPSSGANNTSNANTSTPQASDTLNSSTVTALAGSVTALVLEVEPGKCYRLRLVNANAEFSGRSMPTNICCMLGMTCSALQDEFYDVSLQR